MFSRFGIPKKVVLDNGPQYSSSEFTKFESDYGFKHSTSSPKDLELNGLVERSVQIINRIFQTCNKKQSRPHHGITRSLPVFMIEVFRKWESNPDFTHAIYLYVTAAVKIQQKYGNINTTDGQWHVKAGKRWQMRPNFNSAGHPQNSIYMVDFTTDNGQNG